MGFFSNLFGTNQKRSTTAVGTDYDKAFGTFNEEDGTGTGAMGAYGELMGRGRDMMDPNSALNQAQKARLMSQGQDASAEAARMAQRTAAMSGGAPAGVLAAQTRAGSNRAQESAANAYNQYLQGAMGQGASLLSGATNDMAQMNQNRMNAINAQRQANAQLDSQAAGAKASLIGTGLSLAGTAMGGPVGGMIGGALGSLFGQEGGSVSDLKEIPEGNKGLAKLPQAVRNKMGYMAYGGMVKKYQQGNLVDARDNIGGFLSQSGMIRDKKEGKEDKTEKIEMAMKLAPMIMGAPPMQKGGEVFKPHMMYKGDKEQMANSYEEHLRLKKDGYIHKKQGMKKGGYVYGQEGGMLSQVMGPKGPMTIGTRMGGMKIG